jgi:hypothetical protein
MRASSPGCSSGSSASRCSSSTNSGFSVWEHRGGHGRRVSFPGRLYRVGDERRSFALLRPIGHPSAQERVRDLVLQAYAEYQDTATDSTS